MIRPASIALTPGIAKSYSTDSSNFKDVSPFANEIDQIYLTILNQQNIMKEIKQSEKEYPILHGDKFEQLFDLQTDALSKIEKLNTETAQQYLGDGGENANRTFAEEEIDKLRKELDRTVSRINRDFPGKNLRQKAGEGLQLVRPFHETIGNLHELRARLNQTASPIPEKNLKFIADQLVEIVDSVERRLEKIILHQRNDLSKDFLKNANEELNVQ
ncbi:4677_t:CDS:2, partial [Acaulospora colombiana]